MTSNVLVYLCIGGLLLSNNEQVYHLSGLLTSSQAVVAFDPLSSAQRVARQDATYKRTFEQ